MEAFNTTVTMSLKFDLRIKDGTIFDCYDLVQRYAQDILAEHLVDASLESRGINTDERLTVEVWDCEISVP